MMTEATNAALMRCKNEKIILSLINKEPISRAQIAKRTGLTKAAVTIIVDDLKKRGIVTEEKACSSSVGRNPLMLYLNGDSVYMIGVNIARTGITVGITDLCGRVIIENSLSISSPDKAFDKIKQMVKKQLSKTDIDASKIYKVAVVTPGPVDVKEGKILNPPNFNEWHNTSIVHEMKKIFDYDIVFGNVATAAAIAEKYFGTAKESNSFIALQVDEGIGAGIIINDKVFGGTCEIGHISIKYDGELCECGNVGCLEKYACIPNILKNTGYKSWGECVDKNDEKILCAESEYLSTAIITAKNIFNIDSVILCGDITYKSEKLISKISENIFEKILVKNEFFIYSGKVTSQSLIAASIGMYDFYN